MLVVIALLNYTRKSSFTLLSYLSIPTGIFIEPKKTTSEIGKSICELRLEALRRKYESISEGLWQWLLDEFIHTPKALRYAKVWAMAVKEYQSLWCFNLANSEHFDDYSEISQMPFSCVGSLSDILPQLTSEKLTATVSCSKHTRDLQKPWHRP